MDTCSEQERLLAEEADAWLAHKVLETHNPNSPDLTKLSIKAGAASYQLRLHVDSCPLCRREKDPDVPVAVPNS
jgi:hypothetical protein